MENLRRFLSRFLSLNCMKPTINDAESSEKMEVIEEVKLEVEILHVVVPQKDFVYFRLNRPETEALSLAEFIHMYRYVVPAPTPRPRFEYIQAAYRFQSEDKLYILKGWVPRNCVSRICLDTIKEENGEIIDQNASKAKEYTRQDNEKFVNSGFTGKRPDGDDVYLKHGDGCSRKPNPTNDIESNSTAKGPEHKVLNVLVKTIEIHDNMSDRNKPEVTSNLREPVMLQMTQEVQQLNEHTEFTRLRNAALPSNNFSVCLRQQRNRRQPNNNTNRAAHVQHVDRPHARMAWSRHTVIPEGRIQSTDWQTTSKPGKHRDG